MPRNPYYHSNGDPRIESWRNSVSPPSTSGYSSASYNSISPSSSASQAPYSSSASSSSYYSARTSQSTGTAYGTPGSRYSSTGIYNTPNPSNPANPSNPRPFYTPSISTNSTRVGPKSTPQNPLGLDKPESVMTSKSQQRKYPEDSLVGMHPSYRNQDFEGMSREYERQKRERNQEYVDDVNAHWEAQPGGILGLADRVNERGLVDAYYAGQGYNGDAQTREWRRRRQGRTPKWSESKWTGGRGIDGRYMK